MGGPLFSSAEITARRSQTEVHERQNILEGGGRIAGTMKERLLAGIVSRKTDHRTLGRTPTALI